MIVASFVKADICAMGVMQAIPRGFVSTLHALAKVAQLSVRLAKNRQQWFSLLASSITRAKFENGIEALYEECKAHEDDCGRRLFHNPNLALPKLGNSLLKIAKLKLGIRSSAKNWAVRRT